jgi:hypothetical protein
MVLSVVSAAGTALWALLAGAGMDVTCYGRRPCGSEQIGGDRWGNVIHGNPRSPDSRLKRFGHISG